MSLFSPSLLVSDETDVLRENSAVVTYEQDEPRSMIQIERDHTAAYNEAMISHYKAYLNKSVISEAVSLQKHDTANKALQQLLTNMLETVAYLETVQPNRTPVSEMILGKTESVFDILESMCESHPMEYAKINETAEGMEINIARNGNIDPAYLTRGRNVLGDIAALTEEVRCYLLAATNRYPAFSAEQTSNLHKELASIGEAVHDFGIRGTVEPFRVNAAEYLFEDTRLTCMLSDEPISHKFDYTDLKAGLRECLSVLEEAYTNGVDVVNESEATDILLSMDNSFNNFAHKLSAANEYMEDSIAKEVWQYNAIVESVISLADGQKPSHYMPIDSDYDMDRIFSEFYRDIDGVTDRYSLYVEHTRTEAITKEASIMEDASMSSMQKTQAMQALNETIGQKIKKAWNNTMNTLKTLFAKFMEKLRANFTTTKHYLDKYKNIILDKNFANNKYGTQDLKLGINRLLKAEIPALNFNEMGSGTGQNGGSILDNPAEFFNKRIRPKLGDASGEPQIADNGTIQDITNFWKSYFCMENHKKEITGPEFQKDVRFYYNFLYDIAKIERTCKKTLRDVEKSINDIMKQAGVDVGNVENNNNNNATNTSSNGNVNSNANNAAGNGNGEGNPVESFYSYINGAQMVFTEFENLGPVNPNGGNNNSQPAQQPQNTSGVDNLKNVSGNRDDANDDAQVKATQRNLMDTRCTNYANNASAMLKAKMSACEFIRNECMGIIRAHVQSYIGGTATGEDNTQQNNQQQQPEEQKDKKTKKTWKEKRAEAKAAKQAAREAKRAAKAAKKNKNK